MGDDSDTRPDSGSQGRAPLYGMTFEQEVRFFVLSGDLRALGYFVRSEPLEGQIDGWLSGISSSLVRIQAELADVNKAYRTRGRSKAALYHLTSREWFDPGFGIALTHDQRKANDAYAAKLAKGKARWDAAFGCGE